MARSTVEAQLVALRKQRELLNQKEQVLLSKSHDKTLAQILQLAKDAGLTAGTVAKAFAEVKPGRISKATKRPKAAKKGSLAGKKIPPKYRNPANPMQTWTGRGVTPGWVQALKANGTLETAFIALPTATS
ncbi:MAG: H-NS histone family protein [Gammaproteobacteria bacterium]|nr:H-NS histone family protein [Gammaproteobacteria bacterium]